MSKLKVLFHTDIPIANTGFAKHIRNLLTYLYKTGKYDLSTFCCGVPWDCIDLQRMPWKGHGTCPNSEGEFNAILNQYPPGDRDAHKRLISYGAMYIDRMILEEKPDVYIGIQDIWGLDFCTERFWWNKIHSVIWTTLDSLPLLKKAIDVAPRINNYWMWSKFATTEMHRLGHKHVKTVNTAVDETSFYRLEKHKKQELRTKFGIDLDTFVIGFVARNQLRKQFPQLIESFSIFKKNNPKTKTKLFFHTGWKEDPQMSWNLHHWADYYNVDHKDILTTYICKMCRGYHIRDYIDHDIDCPLCKASKSCITTCPQFGVDEIHLNEIYNLMDVYVHPISSGGIEIPVLEAKLTELITCVTNYSCGEQLCEDGAGSLVLDFTKYYEHGSNFIKSTTLPSSIVKQLQKVYDLDDSKRREIGQKARKWVIDNYSVGIVGKQMENFLDNLTPTNFNFEIPKPRLKNPNANLDEIINNNNDNIFVNSCYQHIFGAQGDKDGVQYWLKFLSQHQNNRQKRIELRQQMIQYMRNKAAEENAKTQQFNIENFIVNNGNKRLLLVCKESIGDILYATALIKGFKSSYPDYDIYVGCDPQYFEIFDGNQNIFKLIPYHPMFESEIHMTGQGSHRGYFDVYCHLTVATQRLLNYLTNNNIVLPCTS